MPLSRQAQFEWYAHEQIARKAGVAEAAFPLMRERARPERLVGVLREDEAAVYRCRHSAQVEGEGTGRGIVHR